MRADLEAIEQMLRLTIVIEIEIRVRMSIAGEKLLHAQRARAVRRADEHDVAFTTREQLDAAQNERAHENLTQLAVRLDDPEQPIALDLDDLARRDRTNARQARAAGQHRRLAGEHSRPDGHDQSLAVSSHAQGVETSVANDEHARHRLAGFDEHLAWLRVANAAAHREAVDLLRRQRGIDVIGPRRERRAGEWSEGRHRVLLTGAIQVAGKLPHAASVGDAT